LHREGNGHEESDEKEGREKSFEKMQAHQSVFTRRTADSVARFPIAGRLAAPINVPRYMACAFYRTQASLSRIRHGRTSKVLLIRLRRGTYDAHFRIMDGKAVHTQENEAPRSSLLRRSSHFGYEGRKLRGILRNSPTRRPEPLGGVPKPLPSFAKATEGSPRLHPRSSLLRRSSYFSYEGRKLRGIRRRRINQDA
jgi:hypothetical protein